MAKLLKSKNDESRFGLTRATILRQCDMEASQSSSLMSHCTERKTSRQKANVNSKLQIYFYLLPFYFLLLFVPTAEINSTRTSPQYGVAVINTGSRSASLVK